MRNIVRAKPIVNFPRIRRTRASKFKCVHPSKPIYSARISRGFRAVGILAGETITWIWIGSHADYDRLLSKP